MENIVYAIIREPDYNCGGREILSVRGVDTDTGVFAEKYIGVCDYGSEGKFKKSGYYEDICGEVEEMIRERHRRILAVLSARNPSPAPALLTSGKPESKSRRLSSRNAHSPIIREEADCRPIGDDVPPYPGPIEYDIHGRPADGMVRLPAFSHSLTMQDMLDGKAGPELAALLVHAVCLGRLQSELEAERENGHLTITACMEKQEEEDLTMTALNII